MGTDASDLTSEAGGGTRQQQRQQWKPKGRGADQQSPPRTIDLYLPSELGWERPAVDLVASVAGRMGFPSPRVEDIKTAVAEAVINAIEHGNGQDASQTVLVELTPGERSLEINVKDQSSVPFTPPDAEEPPDLEERLAGLTPARGWGAFLIRTLVDEVEYSSTGSGNVVRMVIHLEAARSDPRTSRP